MALATRAEMLRDVPDINNRQEVDALCDGASFLSGKGNRVSAVALLWAAMCAEPTNLIVHRRLAATLADGGDVDSAADEYARFIQLALKNGDVHGAAGELVQGIAALGDVSRLQAAAAHPACLGDVAQALKSQASSPAIEATTSGRPQTDSVADVIGRDAPSLADALTRPFDVLASRIDAGGFRSLGFTSTLLGEGVSTTALGTALSIAALRQGTVLLVDANWIQPSLSSDARLESGPGLGDYLAKKADLADVVRPTSLSRLSFLPIGDRSAARPTLGSLTSFLADDVATYQTVIVDLPPVLAGESYVLPWAAALDQLFVVLREGATPLALARDAIGRVGVRNRCIVLNRTTTVSTRSTSSPMAVNAGVN